MGNVALNGASIGHGGGATGTVGSVSKLVVEGRSAVHVGCPGVCSEHGEVTVTEGSERVFVDGAPVTRVGDAVSCGAVVLAGPEISLKLTIP